MTTEPTDLRERIKRALWRHDNDLVPSLAWPQAALLAGAVLPIVREAQAAAWDEGKDAGLEDAHGGYEANPYTEEGTDDE